MSLSLAKPTKVPKLTVVNNYGSQNAAGVTATQNASPVQAAQPAAGTTTYHPAAGAHSVQSAISAAQIAAIADQQRQAAITAAARQREIVRSRVQGEVNNKTAANLNTFKLQLSNVITPRLALAKSSKPVKITVPDYRSDTEKKQTTAYLTALRDADYIRTNAPSGGFSKLFDKLSFGQDRRDIAARSYAEKQLQTFSTKHVDDYSKRVNTFISEQAKRRSAIEKAKFTNRAAFDRAVNEYSNWERQNIAGLESSRSQLQGMYEGYTKASGKPLTSGIAKAAAGFIDNTKPAQNALGKVWKYTLGSGDKNIPSLVTAPSRAINLLGNLNTKNRQIYKEGGGSFNRVNSPLNAWQTTQNQRNFNVKPWTDITANSNTAHKMFDKSVKNFIDSQRKLNPNYKTDPNTILKTYVSQYNLQHRAQNTALDFSADPLLLSGPASKAGFVDKLAKTTKIGSFISKLNDATKSSKSISWLRAEAKLPHQNLADTVNIAKVAQADAQKTILPGINELNKRLASNKQLDVSVIHDIGKLTDHEAAILQRMVDNKVTGTDRLRFIDLPGRRGGQAAARDKLETLARRYTEFTEKLKFADNVQNTRFGKGKRLYSPTTAWIQKSGKDLEHYNFLKFSKRLKPQSAADLHQGIIDRYFKSNIDEQFANLSIRKKSELTSQRQELLKQYDNIVNPHREAVQKAYEKTRTPYGRTRTALAKYGPSSVWKKSVLKYRPAWYVNNALYNVQGAALAGGPRALYEHARLLRPKNFRSALAGVPDPIRTKVANEIGSDKIAKFGNNLENWSRIAAYRALKSKGLTDEKALNRVNKYLLDYQTKNWERPLKSVVPFWSFQKGIAKAATQMPFDRPIAAKVYNKVDSYQQQQFNNDFNKIVPRLQKLGYSDAEIEAMRTKQAQSYNGRLKIGTHYITTPFNAFSEKGLSNLGLNPYMAAFGETAAAKDNFGRPLSGNAASFTSRLTSKFPQAQLAKEGIAKALIKSGKIKPTQKWIGAAGSEGYGLTKEAQGYNSSKPNYKKSLNPGANFDKDLAAFLGKPSDLPFDKTKFLERQTLNKLKTEYFATDWKSMDYPTATAKRNALFKKYGITSDKFYKGELSKYDSADTTRIKSMKENAAKKTAALFAEYSKQPKGTRNLWATQKLKTLVDSGYFDKNPFLKSFNWTDPNSIQKAYKQLAYMDAKKSGDFTAYEKKYGVSAKKQKFYDYQLAKKSGDWSGFEKKYGPMQRKHTAITYNGKFFKTEESKQKYIDGEFWRKYGLSKPSTKKQLLDDNPQYNTRANWTASQWLKWRADDKNAMRQKLMTVNGFSSRLMGEVKQAKSKADPYLAFSKRAKTKKLVFHT
jgi:hypothetical protein